MVVVVTAVTIAVEGIGSPVMADPLYSYSRPAPVWPASELIVSGYLSLDWLYVGTTEQPPCQVDQPCDPPQTVWVVTSGGYAQPPPTTEVDGLTYYWSDYVDDGHRPGLMQLVRTARTPRRLVSDGFGYGDYLLPRSAPVWSRSDLYAAGYWQLDELYVTSSEPCNYELVPPCPESLWLVRNGDGQTPPPSAVYQDDRWYVFWTYVIFHEP